MFSSRWSGRASSAAAIRPRPDLAFARFRRRLDARAVPPYIGGMHTRSLALAAVLLAFAAPVSDAIAEDYSVGTLQISNPWTRATPKGATVAGGYLKITNKGSAPDRLVGGGAAVAGRFEGHQQGAGQGVGTGRRQDATGRRRSGDQAGRDRRAQAGIDARDADGAEAAAREGPEGQRHAGIREGRQDRDRIRSRGARRVGASAGQA